MAFGSDNYRGRKRNYATITDEYGDRKAALGHSSHNVIVALYSSALDKGRILGLVSG